MVRCERGVWVRLGAALAVAAALALGGCGGGDEGPRTSAVRVVGDSLNDNGTFGYRFTVQGTAQQPNLIWTERVAQALGAPALCPRYSGTPSSMPVATAAAAGCTSFAVGGAEINPAGSARDATPLSVLQQLKDAGAKPYAADELLLVDGGGNDAAALVGAFLGAATDGGAAYAALLAELLSPAQVSAAASGGQAALVAAGGLYMQALADRLVQAIRSEALAKGAQRVVVLNMPNIVLTPRLANVLAGVRLLAGEASAAAAEAAARAWVQAFNARLAQGLAGESRVVVADFEATLADWVAQPARYGFSNARTPACPPVGLSGGLPSYNLATCTAASLAANPPAGASGPDWWQSYVFSDHFHGTPRANQLMAELVLAMLKQKGWS